MSLCHGSALEEISGMSGNLETIDVCGLNSATLKHLKDCVDNHRFNKVEVLLHLVQSLITTAHEEGIIAIPPPILSRVYQTISRGYVNLLNTKKITDTKFPFPYVQLIIALLLLHTLLTPVVVSAVIDHLVWAPILAFVPVFGAHAINFIAIELEDPFGEDDNDLPLAHFQAEMNNCLLMLLHPNTDIIAGVSDNCITDFEELKSTVCVCTDDEAIQSPVPVARRRVSVQLFDPNFKLIGSSKSNLEQVVAAMEEVHLDLSKDDFDEVQPTLPSEASAAAHVEENNERDPNENTAVTTGGGRCFPEPKLMHNKELETILVKSMEEFNHSLQCWTRTMEDQVRELSTRFSFCALNMPGENGTAPKADARPGQKDSHARPVAGSALASPRRGGSTGPAGTKRTLQIEPPRSS